MKAMVLDAITNLAENPRPLRMAELPTPEPGSGEILIKVLTCGVCHTELDEIEGRTPPPALPVVLGHQVVGLVEENGPGAARFTPGTRVGVAWIFHACGECEQCRAGNENLCPNFLATGRDANGGYAEYMTISEDFAYPIPDAFDDVQAAPLLCAGAIGYRSLMLTNLQDGQNLGLTGFGASAHLVISMVRHRYPNAKIYVFARSPQQRTFARELGAVWAGDIDATAPASLHAIIDTTPAWKPIVEALRNLAPGGRLVINAIRKEGADKEYLLKLEYPEHLWMEKEIKSVANVTRADVSGFLELAAAARILPEVETFPLAQANEALQALRAGSSRGAKVLVIG
jgi:propanol-preferring alcohol dehydrogenase